MSTSHPSHESHAAPNASSNNPWFASTVGLAGLIIGYAIATGAHSLSAPTMANLPANNVPTAQQPAPTPTPAAPAPDPSANATPPDVGTGPFIGKADAPISVIEFTDFQCPFCQRHFQQTFGDIKKNYVDTGKIKYYVRYFPLSFHPNAEKAAETAACADDQGKYWEMHDKLFTAQNDWSNLDAATALTTFKGYAKDLGLVSAAFATCIDSGSKAAMIAKDEAAGSASGVNGTPGFWILGPNGKHQMISGAYPFATFQSAIDGMTK